MDIADVWANAKRQGQRLDLRKKDADMRMPVNDLLGFIATCYMRKTVSDHLDDKEGSPRLSLPEFLYFMSLDDAEDTKNALKQMSRIVANVLLYCSLGMCVCYGSFGANKQDVCQSV